MMQSGVVKSTNIHMGPAASKVLFVATARETKKHNSVAAVKESSVYLDKSVIHLDN